MNKELMEKMIDLCQQTMTSDGDDSDFGHNFAYEVYDVLVTILELNGYSRKTQEFGYEGEDEWTKN